MFFKILAKCRIEIILFDMKREGLLAKLEETAEKVGLIIRYENLGQLKGGLCRIKEKNFIFINKSLPITSKIELISQELSIFDFKDIYLIPEVRQKIFKSKNDFISNEDLFDEEKRYEA